MIVKELITLLGFEIDDKKLKEFDKAVDKTKQGLTVLGATVVTSGVALFALMKTATDTAGSIERLSYQSGVSTKNIQTLGYAAKLSGSDIDEMARGLQVLTKNIVDASKNAGGENAKTFRSLGIRIFDSAGRVRDASEIFVELSGAFQKIPTPAQKTAVSMQLLGKSGAGLINTLNKGPAEIKRLQAEIESLGILTDQQIASLGAVSDGWNRILTIMGFIKNSIAAEIAPTISALLADIKDFIVANKELIKSNLLGFFKALAAFMKVVWSVSRGFGKIVLWLTDKLGGLEWMMKALLTVLVALGSGAVVSGLILLTKLVVGLGTAFLIASAKAIAIGVAIAAAVALAFLVLEDIFTFFTDGGESFTGDIVNAMKKGLKGLWSYFEEFMGWLEKKLYIFFNALGQTIVDIVLFPLKGLIASVEWIFEKLGMLGKKAPNIQKMSASMSAGSGVLAGATPSVQNTNNGGNVNMEANIQVQVGSGADAGQVAQSVESGAISGFEEMLRQTRRFSSPTGVY